MLSDLSNYFNEIQINFKNFSFLKIIDAKRTISFLKKYKITLNNTYLKDEFLTLKLSFSFLSNINSEETLKEFDIGSNDFIVLMELWQNEAFLKKTLENEKYIQKIFSFPNLIGLLTPEIIKKMIDLFDSDMNLLKSATNVLFFYVLIGNFQTELFQVLLEHNILTKTINFDLFCLLFHYVTEVKSNHLKDIENNSESQSLWSIHWKKILTIKTLNLENHPRLSSRAYKLLFVSFFDDFFFLTKLQTPEILYSNKYYNSNNEAKPLYFENLNDRLKQKVLGFGEEIINEIMIADMHEYDDYIGTFVLELIKILPGLEEINLSGMNFNDDFCEKLSQVLMQSYITKGRVLHLNICHNYRITNVGLKYLYLVFKIARNKFGINSTLKSHESKKVSEKLNTKTLEKQENKLSINFSQILARNKKLNEYHQIFSIQKSKRTEIILNKGFGEFIIHLLNYFLNRKTYMFCYDCELHVCSVCHSFHKLNKQCVNIRTSLFVSTDCKVLKNRIIKNNVKTNTCKNFFIKIFKCFIFPCLCFLRGFLKCFKKTLKTLNKEIITIAEKLSVQPKKTRSLYAFLCDPIKQILIGNISDFKINQEEYKFSENLGDLNKLFDNIILTFYFRVNFVIFLTFCIFPPIFFSNLWYSNLCFFICSISIFLFEFMLTLKIIKIVNLKSPVVKSFSILWYGRTLLGTLIKKYSSYANFVFMIQNFFNGNYIISIFSLCFLSFFYVFASLLFAETGKAIFNIRKIKSTLKENYYEDHLQFFLQRKKSVTVLTPAHNINIASRTALSLEFDCLSNLLDQFSTKNAIRLFGLYVPQIIILSFGKCCFYDIPNFILQIYIYSSYESFDYKSIITLSLTIMSIFKSLLRLFLARASKINKNDFKSLEIPLENEEDLKESEERKIIQFVH